MSASENASTSWVRKSTRRPSRCNSERRSNAPSATARAGGYGAASAGPGKAHGGDQIVFVRRRAVERKEGADRRQLFARRKRDERVRGASDVVGRVGGVVQVRGEEGRGVLRADRGDRVGERAHRRRAEHVREI